MLILNFTHPLTLDQRAQIEALAHTSIDEVRPIPSKSTRPNHSNLKSPPS